MAAEPEHTTVFEWQPEITDHLRTRERFTRLVTFGAGGVSAIWGIGAATGLILGDARYLIVLGLMLVTIGILGLGPSRSLRSTRVHVDGNGTLHVTDDEVSTVIDLRIASELAVRRRQARPQWKWSIEVIHCEGAWHTTLAPLASYWNLDETSIRSLEADLQRWMTWANGGSAPAPTPAAPWAPTPTPTEFVWRPADQPNRERNRNRLRLGTIGLALVIAIAATISEAENGLSAVLFSMFVPVLVLIIGFGVDRVYDAGRKFSVRMDSFGLTVLGARGNISMVPRAEIVRPYVVLREQLVASGSTSTRSSNWFLGVERSSGDPIEWLLPTKLGTRFDQNDAMLLEAAIRQRLTTDATG